MVDRVSAKLSFTMSALGYGAALLTGLNVLGRGPWLATLVTLPTAIAGIPLGKYYRKSNDLGLGDVLTAGFNIYTDLDKAVANDALPDLSPIILRPILGEAVDRFTPPPDVDPTEWINDGLTESNVAFIGPAGSAKSVNTKAHCDRIVAKHGLEAIYGVLSTHFEWEVEKPIDQWFPGVPREALEAVVSRTKEDNMKRLRAFYQLFKKRRDNDETKAPYRFLIIDDYQYQFPKGSEKEVNEILESIVEEARKYNLRIIVVMHSLKSGRSDVDSEILWSMTCVLFEKAVSDPNARFPADLSGKKREQLLDELLTRTDPQVSPTARYVTAIVRPGSLPIGFAKPEIKVFPNRADTMREFVLAELAWIDEVAPKIDAGIEDGSIKSWTGIVKAANVQNVMHKDADGQYKDERVQALAERYADIIEVWKLAKEGE
jgi:hypothetical protein